MMLAIAENGNIVEATATRYTTIKQKEQHRIHDDRNEMKEKTTKLSRSVYVFALISVANSSSKENAKYISLTELIPESNNIQATIQFESNNRIGITM